MWCIKEGSWGWVGGRFTSLGIIIPGQMCAGEEETWISIANSEGRFWSPYQRNVTSTNALFTVYTLHVYYLPRGFPYTRIGTSRNKARNQEVLIIPTFQRQREIEWKLQDILGSWNHVTRSKLMGEGWGSTKEGDSLVTRAAAEYKTKWR